MKLNPPTVENWSTASLDEVLAVCEKTVKWGDYNLPEIHRAVGITQHFNLTEEQRLTLVAAMVIWSKCECFNLLMEKAMLEGPKFIPVLKPIPESELSWDERVGRIGT